MGEANSYFEFVCFIGVAGIGQVSCPLQGKYIQYSSHTANDRNTF